MRFHGPGPFVDVETREVTVPAGYQDAMNRAAEREARYLEFKIAGVAFMVWLGLCGALLGIGHSVAWVIRGFQKNNI